jgi:hypothetical protein
MPRCIRPRGHTHSLSHQPRPPPFRRRAARPALPDRQRSRGWRWRWRCARVPAYIPTAIGAGCWARATARHCGYPGGVVLGAPPPSQRRCKILHPMLTLPSHPRCHPSLRLSLSSLLKSTVLSLITTLSYPPPIAIRTAGTFCRLSQQAPYFLRDYMQ